MCILITELGIIADVVIGDAWVFGWYIKFIIILSYKYNRQTYKYRLHVLLILDIMLLLDWFGSGNY